MTVVRRRSPARTGRGTPKPLKQRFPKGRRVQVYEDFHDERYAGRFGRVVQVVDERDEHYPRGRVAVMLVVDELYAKLFTNRPPNPVWFRPADLDRSPDA